MSDLKISLIQCNQVWEDKTANLQHFEELLKQVPSDTELIVFPEMFHTGFSMSNEQMAETMDGEGVNWLKNKADAYSAAIVATLIISENNHYYNRLVFVYPDGEIQFYDKQKLFAYSNEHLHYTPGSRRVIVNYKGWNILLLTCYDLRFPEIARNYVKDESYDYDILIYPANWPERRSLHWKRLLPARAIENQAYVIGVNRVGKGKNDLPYSGDSAVYSPLGEQLTDSVAHKETILNAILDKTQFNQIRKELPFLKDR